MQVKVDVNSLLWVISKLVVDSICRSIIDSLYRRKILYCSCCFSNILLFFFLDYDQFSESPFNDVFEVYVCTFSYMRSLLCSREMSFIST